MWRCKSEVRVKERLQLGWWHLMSAEGGDGNVEGMAAVEAMAVVEVETTA